MITALMLDDEASSLQRMQRLIADVVPEISRFIVTSDPLEARSFLKSEKPQLVFLDVEMPVMTGFEFLQSVPERNFAVIFSTAFSKYAVQALRFSAIDFLLKPVQPDELRAAIKRFIEQPPVLEQLQNMYGQLFRNLASESEKEFKLTLSKGSRLYFISPDDIVWCEADDNYTLLHTASNETFTMARTLKEVEEMLAVHGFIRVHKSSLVNKTYVDHIHNGDQLKLRNGTEVTVSRRRLEEVKKALRI
jgi:two-component system, LytTR family, response regulator